MSKTPFFPPRSRLVLGVLAIAVTSALTLGRWYTTQGPLETLAWFESHRGPGDALAYASAVYHASHAQAEIDRRWTLGGYATHAVAGTILGFVLIAAARVRRTA